VTAVEIDPVVDEDVMCLLIVMEYQDERSSESEKIDRSVACSGYTGLFVSFHSVTFRKRFKALPETILSRFIVMI
jgi:hypothetical protein